MTPHALATLTEVALGFAVGARAGVLVGYLLARSRLAERLLSPYLVAAQATPILALAPLIALWFGPGLAARCVICALIVFFPVAVATMVGIRSVDARAARARPQPARHALAGASAKLEIPAALPQILGGMRVGVTLAVDRRDRRRVGRRRTGLGVLINLARGSLFDIPLMFATLLTIAAHRRRCSISSWSSSSARLVGARGMNHARRS